MKTISFYSYKGGVGRSAFLASFAQWLINSGRSCVVLDGDLNAPSLHHKFLESVILAKDVWDLNKQNVGLQLYILDYLAKLNQAADDITEYFIPLNSNSSEINCFFMPAGNAPTHDYASKHLRIDWKILFPPKDPAPGIDLFLDLRNRIEEEFNPDFLLVDLPAGITNIGVLGYAFLPDISVCLFICSPENLEGIRLAIDALKNNVSKSPVIFPILSRVSREQDEEAVIKAVKIWIAEDFRIIHESSGKEFAQPTIANPQPVAISSEYLEIFQIFKSGAK
ncbi:MAG: hypothetical protein A2Y67_03575 [Candidatus Buchananbacteria bacterium RBG_13_39_9]|uniref:Uncharacterized protein n=1 Tax=Candidatus Buchananbacteria bacterium RBG_13_39_9 TaxID=1797531 RepID=A0A1G1XRT0_9BACT|nr:MAG: hypothetical protein A2Y67_03575 [Candidatus Buchananbacteria bacterium RBG_13_39_9]